MYVYVSSLQAKKQPSVSIFGSNRPRRRWRSRWWCRCRRCHRSMNINVENFRFASYFFFRFVPSMRRFGSDSEGLIGIFKPMCRHYECGIHIQNPKYAIHAHTISTLFLSSSSHLESARVIPQPKPLPQVRFISILLTPTVLGARSRFSASNRFFFFLLSTQFRASHSDGI